MKRFITIVFLINLASCTLPYSKNVTLVKNELVGVGERVEIDDFGVSILIPHLIVSKPKAATELIIDLRASYGCKELKNIETDYYQIYWFLFGIPKVRVTADCVR